MRQMAEANKGPRRKKDEAGHATKKQDPESTEPRTYWRPIATDPGCTLQKNAGNNKDNGRYLLEANRNRAPRHTAKECGEKQRRW